MLIGIDLETSGLDPVKDDILIIALQYDDGRTEALDARQMSKQEMVELFSRDCTWIAHNAKFDFKFIYAKTGVLPQNIFCTMLASQILTNGKKLESECKWSRHSSNFETVKGKVVPKKLRHGLLPTQERFLGINEMAKEDKKSLQMSFVGHKGPFSRAQLDYAESDVVHIRDLYEEQMRLLKEYQLNVVSDLEMKVLRVVIHMESHGGLIDQVKWRELIKGWEDRHRKIELELDRILRELAKDHESIRGGIYTRKRNQYDVYQTSLFTEPKKVKRTNQANINYASAAMIKTLFDKLGIEMFTKEDGVPSVDEEGLMHILNENPGHYIEPFIEKLLEYREYSKLLSTYGGSFLDRLDENGYIHTEYTQCRTDTGRFSSHNPNLQNLPNGSPIRECFVVPPGHKMVTYDMANAEIRIAADYSKEKVIIDSILKGTDMHSHLASKSFSIIFGEPFEVSKSSEPVMVRGIPIKPSTLRKAHKPVTFAKFYKGGANRIRAVLARYINMFSDNPQKTAKQVSAAIDQALPSLTAYLSACIQQANEPRELCGHTEYYLRGSKTGRIRFFKKDAYGDAANFPIQSTNAEAIKIAMVRMHEWFDMKGWGRIVLTVHDELACEVPEQHAEECAEVLQKVLAESLGIFMSVIPGGADGEINDYWVK